MQAQTKTNIFMKRLFTLLFALLATVTWVQAGNHAPVNQMNAASETTPEDNDKLIHLVEGSSDGWDDIPEVGVKSNTNPQFTLTNDVPVFFFIGQWQFLLDGEWTTAQNTPDEFVAGAWRYKGSVAKNYESDLRFADDVRVLINGEEWEVEVTDILLAIYSPTVVIDNSTKIRQVEATTSPDWTTIVKKGETVATKPEFDITKGSPAFIHPFSWQKKVGGSWEDVSSGTFTPGKWRFHARVIRDREVNDNNNQYQLAHKVKVVVDGQEWETEYSKIYNNVNYAEVYSPEIIIEEPHGTLGTQGTWRLEDGVLTIDYVGQMPWNCTSKTTDPEVAYRLKWIDYLADIKEIVITGVDVEVQPYFLYYSGDGPSGSHPDDHVRTLTLGSGVKKVGKQAFALYDLKRVNVYRIDPPVLASDLGESNCFWKSRIQENQAFLYLPANAGIGYAMIKSEWAYFNHSTNHLDMADAPVGIKLIDSGQQSTDNRDAWYTLDGRKLSGKPTQKGIYITGGRKVVIK